MASVPASPSPRLRFSKLSKFPFRARTDKKVKSPNFICSSRTENVPSFILSIDVGTSGTKVALVRNDGKSICTSFCPHSSVSFGSWESITTHEQERPIEWFQATINATKRCLASVSAQKSDISAVSITGQMQDIIAIPKNLTQDIPPAILYSDGRAIQESKELESMAGGAENIINVTGMRQGGTSLLAKLRWLDKHSPSTYEDSQKILFGGHSFVIWKLQGSFLTDSTTASTTGLTLWASPEKYAESLLEQVSLSHWISKFPLIVPSTAPCGYISLEAGKLLGSSYLEGLPIFHCCGDAGAVSLGCGAGNEGHDYVYLGTSGWIAGSYKKSEAFSKLETAPGVFRLAHPNKDLVFCAGSIMTAGGNLSWAVENFHPENGNDKDVIFKEVNELAREVPAGSRGLIYLPYLQGERCPFEDEGVRAAMIGLCTDTSRGAIYRSVMEGVAMAILSAKKALFSGDAQTSLTESPLRVVGGGARSSLWPEIFASMFNREVEVLADSQEVGVKGAAIMAALWLGWIDSLSPSGHWLSVERKVEPNSADSQVYEKLHLVFLKCTDYMRLLQTDLADFR